MARRIYTVEEVTDDLDGGKVLDEGEAVNVQFSYGGKTYELDTSKANKEQMDKYMERFITAARVVRPNTSAAAPSRPQTGQQRQGGGGGRQAPHNPLAIPPGERTPYQAEKARQAELVPVRQWAIDNGMNQSRVGKVRDDIIEQYNNAHGTDIALTGQPRPRQRRG